MFPHFSEVSFWPGKASNRLSLKVASLFCESRAEDPDPMSFARRLSSCLARSDEGSRASTSFSLAEYLEAGEMPGFPACDSAEAGLDAGPQDSIEDSADNLLFTYLTRANNACLYE